MIDGLTLFGILFFGRIFCAGVLGMILEVIERISS